MDLSAHDVQEKQFHDAWRGYRQEEVDDFLDEVAETIDYYKKENAALKERSHELEQAVSTARDTEEMLKKTLVTAQRAAEEAIASAKAKAQRIVDESAEAAARTRREAAQEVERNKKEAAEHVAAAEAKARRTVEAAEELAARTKKETAERVGAAEAESERKALEAARRQALRERELQTSIDRLTSHESEVKARLKAFFEQQARALDKLGDRPARAPRKVASPPEDRAETPQEGESGEVAARRDETITLPEAGPSREGPSSQEKPEAKAPEPGSGRRSILGLFRGEDSRTPEPQEEPPPSRGEPGPETGEEVRLIPSHEGPPETPGPSGGATQGTDEDSVRIVAPPSSPTDSKPAARRKPEEGGSPGTRK